MILSMNPCKILTERLCLRTWIESDSQPFITMNRDADVMRFFPKQLSAPESMAMISRINLSFDNNKFGLFAVEHRLTKKFLGFTGFSSPQFESFFTPCIEIGWRYRRDSWGQGFATEAAKACLVYGFETLGFSKIVSFTSAINRKSIQVMERIAMSHVAEFNHPNIEEGSLLCRHVLYEINAGGIHFK
jgi:RimJ/RimL family protein N-acetyltransferase